MIKIYYVPCRKATREYRLIYQGLVNNPRVELVDWGGGFDFVFLFYSALEDNPHLKKAFPADKLVFIDYCDSSRWVSPIKCRAYFKRSWVKMVVKGEYVVKKRISRPSNFYPLTMAIMDEFIIDEDVKRDVVLSCTIRCRKQRYNRERVLNLLNSMAIKGKTQIGELNKEGARGFNAPLMRDYFRLLRRSRIVVTCNPSKWEGDHRTWEAFANGALVFIDKIYTPMTHPLEDGKHCIFYDLSDQGLRELRKKIEYFLKETDHAEDIARAGHAFAMKYHRAANRIDEILERIT